MKTTIISYSKTGRNDALATSIASELSVEHIIITEIKTRTNFTIALDLLFNRIPKINLNFKKIENSDLVILVGPVWLGKVAFPLRACLKELRNRTHHYAFISLSGGGDGPNSNSNLNKELEKRTGKRPVAMVNFHIADLLSTNPKPTPEDIDNYQITKKDIKVLTDKIMKVLNPYFRM
jgi:flavodoxin